MINTKPDCVFCFHFSKGIGFKCKAFENDIPDDIILNIKKHLKPLPEQKNDLVFKDVRKMSIAELHASE